MRFIAAVRKRESNSLLWHAMIVECIPVVPFVNRVAITLCMYHAAAAQRDLEQLQRSAVVAT